MSAFHRTEPEYLSSTNLPLGELQIRLTTALGIETLSVLEGSADRARSNGKVFVVTVSKRIPPVSDCDRQKRAEFCKRVE